MNLFLNILYSKLNSLKADEILGLSSPDAIQMSGGELWDVKSEGQKQPHGGGRSHASWKLGSRRRAGDAEEVPAQDVWGGERRIPQWCLFPAPFAQGHMGSRYPCAGRYEHDPESAQCGGLEAPLGPSPWSGSWSLPRPSRRALLLWCDTIQNGLSFINWHKVNVALLFN